MIVLSSFPPTKYPLVSLLLLQTDVVIGFTPCSANKRTNALSILLRSSTSIPSLFLVEDTILTYSTIHLGFDNVGTTLSECPVLQVLEGFLGT